MKFQKVNTEHDFNEFLSNFEIQWINRNFSFPKFFFCFDLKRGVTRSTVTLNFTFGDFRQVLFIFEWIFSKMFTNLLSCWVEPVAESLNLKIQEILGKQETNRFEFLVNGFIFGHQVSHENRGRPGKQKIHGDILFCFFIHSKFTVKFEEIACNPPRILKDCILSVELTRFQDLFHSWDFCSAHN